MLPLRILQTLLFLIYPFAVWFFLDHGMVAAAALFLAAAAALAAAVKRSAASLACAAAALILAVFAWAFDLPQAVKLYPVFVNAALLVLFAASLKTVPVAERFARLRHSELPRHAVVYCRRVTVAWCIFFTCNGLLALDSVLFRSDAWWALYNGAVSYVLIALMFAAEFGIRLLLQRRHDAAGKLP